MEELWKYHPSSKDYMISNFGRAKTFKRYKYGKIMKPNISTSGYIRYTFIVHKRPKTTRIHRLVAELFLDFDPLTGLFIDHIDRNRANNNFVNLRIISCSGNSMNSVGSSKSSSKFKGVSKHSKSNKWVASITINYNPIYLGLFETELEASEAYDRECLKLHKEYACTNEMILKE